MNPTVRSPLPLPPGLSRRSIESKTLRAKRPDTRVDLARDCLPDQTVLQRAHARADICDNAIDVTLDNRTSFHRLSALIALPARAWAPFFNSAVRALVARPLNMDVPIGVGIVLTLAMSIFETLHHPAHAYFDSALILLAFLLVGRALRRRSCAAAADFTDLRTQTVTKFLRGTELAEVPVASVRTDDLILVRPGERIAMDGVVIEGRSEIDQSLVTGETLPGSDAKDSNV